MIIVNSCAQLVDIIIEKPRKVLNIEILRFSAKNSVRRQMDAGLGVLRLRPKSVPLEKVQAIPIIRIFYIIFLEKKFKKSQTDYLYLFKLI